MRKSKIRLATGSLFTGLVLIFLGCAPKLHQWKEVSAEAYNVEKTAPPISSEAEAIISPYRDSLQSRMDVVLGTVSHPMEKAQPQSSLGNWMVDIVRDYVRNKFQENVDLSTTNQGGIRILEIPQGPLKTRKIYELMPFENTVVLMDMEYPLLSRFFQAMIDQGGWPISEGWSLIVENKELKEVLYEGLPIDRSKTYSVLLTDYVANGGSNCAFLRSHKRRSLPILYRDALIEGAKLQQKKEGRIYGQKDQRIIIQ